MSAAVHAIDAADSAPTWTEARVVLLVDHYRSGLSASESAGLIGGVSKNAVVSKRRRLGLLATIGPSPRDDCAAAEERRRPRLSSPRLFRGPPPLPVSPLPQMDLPPPADADPKPLAARRTGRCAWPLGPAEEAGDYRTLFCGAPVKAGRGYCATHAARAYRGRP
ncbi:MAG: GcrA family cell cycle regulator [Caulobacteraceae bacterium]|nr:GcrA family cell cycle regulator [Caulobacteraceae bacterium]